MAYLTPRKTAFLSRFFIRVFPYFAGRDARSLHAFQCLCSIPEYEFIAPIAVAREKIITKGDVDEDGAQLFQAIYDAKTKTLRIVDFNGFMDFHRSRKSIQIFEVIMLQ